MTLPQRPLRGSRISSFYPIKSLPSLASLDSAFQLQEYISLLIRLDVHDVEAIVSLPGKSKEKEGEEGEKNDVAVDEACWIYEQLRRLAQDLTHPLITTLQQECNRASCPEMKAGEWLYLCVAHGNEGAMEQCCAIDYILHTLDSATALLNTPRAFPSRLQIPATSHRHFTSLARRLGRIFAHAYFHHREAFEQAEAESSLYARFLALTRKFDLVPAEFLVIPSRGEGEDGREEEVPRLMGAAVDHREEWTTERSVPHIERGKSQSPPGLGSESPRKMGRNRTDTMVLNEAVVVADELAKVEDDAARSGEEKPAFGAGEEKPASNVGEAKSAFSPEEENPASSAAEAKPAMVESTPEPEEEKPPAPAVPVPVPSALDLSPSESEAGGEPPKTVEESVSMSTEEPPSLPTPAETQPQPQPQPAPGPAPDVAEVVQVKKYEPEPEEVVQPEPAKPEPSATAPIPVPVCAPQPAASGGELVLVEKTQLASAEEKSVLVVEEKGEEESVLVPVVEEKTEQPKPKVVVVGEEGKSGEEVGKSGKEVGKEKEKSGEEEVGEVVEKEKSGKEVGEKENVTDVKPGVEEKAEDKAVEEVEKGEKVEDEVEEGKTETAEVEKVEETEEKVEETEEKVEETEEKVEETEKKVEEPAASVSVSASASV